MKYIVFSGIGTYLLHLHNSHTNSGVDLSDVHANPIFYPKECISDLKSGSIYSSSLLNSIFKLRTKSSISGYYLFYVKDNLFVFSKLNFLYFLLLPLIKHRIYRKATGIAELYKSAFSLECRKILLSKLFESNSNLNDCVDAFSKYVFCKHYSLWIYNPTTETFTCALSSADSLPYHIKKSENCSLNDVLNDDYYFEQRQPNDSSYTHLKGAKTLNRMKLNFGRDGTIGILSYYSDLSNFSISNKLKQQIINVLETKYSEYLHETEEKFEPVISCFMKPLISEDITSFLYNLVNIVSKSLSFEAVSIFLLAKPDNDALVMVATHDIYHDGEPSKQVIYPLDDDSLTTEVFNTSNIIWSYDLEKEILNSRKAVEDTKLGNKNWIGLPLVFNDEAYGVIRVKNKYTTIDGKRHLHHLRQLDFEYLKTLCSFLAGYLSVHMHRQVLVETNDHLREKIREQSVFDTVFLHEVRTPIQTFFSAPERILHELKTPPYSDLKIQSVRKKLADIRILAHRLKFITNAYYFEKIVTSRDYKPLRILNDIVYPVLNITRSYYKRQYTLDVQIEEKRLQNIPVYGDPTLLNIVFNALLDNAAKYSDIGGRPIEITGHHTKSHEYFELIVNNWGIEIEKDEKESIFNRGSRGKNAKIETDGTGIGLFLSRRIMNEHNGSLLLSSTKNPVSFVMKIPTTKEVLENNGKSTTD